MGRKISIDSATLVNKGFEVIEAHHLFNLPYDRIDVVIHPECRIHGMIRLKDGRTLVHTAPPDMKIPIRHALGIIAKPNSTGKIIVLPPRTTLPARELPYTFRAPDHDTFPGIRFGYKVGRSGREACQKFVLANDAAVTDFLAGKIGFFDIYDRIEAALK